MGSYYAEKLAGRRLRRCYEIASPRIRQYLEAEIRHVSSLLRPTDLVLELGCGYGRVASRLACRAARVVGIDTSEASLQLARTTVPTHERCTFLCMDALALGFPDDTFDAVVCVQNGICAFNADPEALLREALRVARPGALVLCSTYADGFWPERLAWFEAQAAEGLLGPIDHAASGDGTIVCTDGFRAGRMTAAGFVSLCARVGVHGEIREVDGSSLFCRIVAGRRDTPRRTRRQPGGSRAE
jgi:2-polyprenyl-6-hydroxyphenyl methylase/3-demethylubiquinone-9 3-methyltransferase